ncbi:MAG: ribosome maturation factor RimM [Luteococcus sp.]|uniref:ribosome maturation factor RimM n=1 Tax=Luteococcus sp. TaxID=1969402 RepID=UPI0026473881|nr:ribosome maturation factor RimM [Luteococcus sp.]MDN5563970.1 ribosome maturation factor RimM [Luteococcus sp.]
MAASVEVVVGSIGRAHGIRGDVAIDVRTDEPERRFAPGAVLRIEGTQRCLTVESPRWHSGRFLVHFAELSDRTAVEQARGQVLVVDVDPDELPEEEDEYYDRQLLGLMALRADGSEAGPVVEVVHLPAQDMLCIRTEAGERLVPFVSELVPRVDLAAGTVSLADLPGLLDDDEAEVAE